MTIDLELALGRIAFRVAAWVLLGEQLDATRAEEIAHHQREVVGWVGVQLGALTGFLPVAVGGRARAMKRHRAVLDAYADEVIARAGTTREGDDVLSRCSAHVWRAGHSRRPSSAATSWASSSRATRPRPRRCRGLSSTARGNRTSGRRCASDPGRATGPFLIEMLRLTPAVWGIPRTPSRAGVTLTSAGITTRVRRGQLATVYLRAINRDPNIWSEPLRFDPSRHETDTTEQLRTLLPFGLGPRGCIGQHLALAELSAAIPALARRGDITIEEPAVEDASFALRVRGGLKGRFTTVAAGRAARLDASTLYDTTVSVIGADTAGTGSRPLRRSSGGRAARVRRGSIRQ